MPDMSALYWDAFWSSVQTISVGAWSAFQANPSPFIVLALLALLGLLPDAGRNRRRSSW
jgi:hypothetical protein